MINYNFKFQIPKSFLILISILMTNLLNAQVKIKGDRDVRTQEIAVSEFSTLAVGNEFDVLLVKSFNPSVTVEADANLHPFINVEVNDSILNITFTKELRRAKEFKVIVKYTGQLNTIILNNNVDVEAQEGIRLTDFTLTLNNDAEINADIITENFKLLNNNDSMLKLTTNCQLNIESKNVTLDLKKRSNNIIEINTEKLIISMQDDADLDIEGFSYDLNLTALNSTDLNAKNLLINVLKSKTRDESQVVLQASDTIHIDSSGKSKLSLYGEPKIIIDQLANEASIYKKEF